MNLINKNFIIIVIIFSIKMFLTTNRHPNLDFILVLEIDEYMDEESI